MHYLCKTSLLAASAFALTACGGDDSPLADALNISGPVYRYVNELPQGPSLVLYRNDELQTSAGQLDFEQASKYYSTVDATSTWSVDTAGTTTPVASTSMTTNGSTRYTLLALPSATVSGGADLVQISDPYDVSLTDSHARLRIVNGASGAPAFDLYLTAPNTDLTNVTPTQANVGYEAAMPASGSDSFSYASGTYEVRLTQTGTKTVFFDAQITSSDQDDTLLVVLPTTPTSTGTDVKIENIPSADNEINADILNTLQSD